MDERGCMSMKIWKKPGKTTEMPSPFGDGKIEPLMDTAALGKKLAQLMESMKYDDMASMLEKDARSKWLLIGMLKSHGSEASMASNALAQSARRNLDIRLAIPRLCMCIKSGNSTLSANAADALFSAASGAFMIDIRSAENALWKKLDTKYPTALPPHFAMALIFATRDQARQGRAVSILSKYLSGTSMLQCDARALARAHEKGADIGRAVSNISMELGSQDIRVRKKSARMLSELAQTGCGVSTAVPMLTRCLGDKDPEVRKYSVLALESAAHHGINISAAIPKLSGCLGDLSLQVEAAGALYEAGKHGADITHAVPALAGCLLGQNKLLRERAVLALSVACDTSGAHPALDTLMERFSGNDQTARQGAYEALREVAPRIGRYVREYMLMKLQGLVDEPGFQGEMAANSEWYIDVLTKMQNLVACIGAGMREAA
jgi:hypothetical protein